jgi:peroxiredoxin
MTVRVGDTLPAATMAVMGPDGPETITTEQLFAGKKAVLFALPGAFTPTCSQAHLPGFVAKSDVILAKGVDRIVCLSVNDAFVMDAWGKQQNADDVVMMVGDGSAEFTQAVGLEVDLSARQMGLRSQRYAMIVDDGVVTALRVEAPGQFEVSGAEAMLDLL